MLDGLHDRLDAHRERGASSGGWRAVPGLAMRYSDGGSLSSHA
ncbi:MAG: hypothetical protein ACHP9Z_19820 [Streptosporangiales bacterium]